MNDTLIIKGDEIEKIKNFVSNDKVYEIKITELGDIDLSKEDFKDIEKQINKAIKESK